MEEQAQAFLDNLVPVLESLEKRINEAYWKVATTGKKKDEEEHARLMKELLQIYVDPDRFQTLKKLQEGSIHDPLLKRQIHLLYLQFSKNQMSPEQIEERVRLETEIESVYVHFRAVYRGKKVSNNEIMQAFREERDTYRRKDVWKASKQVGEIVKEPLLQLVRLRNRVARVQGYRDYYQMSLFLNEIDEAELFSLLDELKEKTDQPFSDIKKEMDKVIADRYRHLRPEGIRPWHYEDPFFQEAPMVFDVDLDRFFRDRKIEDLSVQTFREIGLDVTRLLEQSDLYERAGKLQHAFCMDLDRKGDIRILCNLRADSYWMGTLLHELGHGVYDQYIDEQLPYLLRKPAHTSATEAVAIMMERLSQEPVWLHRVAGIPLEQVEEVRDALYKQSVLKMLVQIRWCMVMIYFERDLYADPEQNLNRLWWDYVERFQFLPRPENRNAPDWAAKIHLSSHPVYYQNYLLGDLMASQIMDTLSQEVKEENPLVEGKVTGGILRERLFKSGATYPWRDWLKKATGETLNSDYFIRQIADKSGA